VVDERRLLGPEQVSIFVKEIEFICSDTDVRPFRRYTDTIHPRTDSGLPEHVSLLVQEVDRRARTGNDRSAVLRDSHGTDGTIGPHVPEGGIRPLRSGGKTAQGKNQAAEQKER